MTSFKRSKADFSGNDDRVWIWKNHIPHYQVTVVNGDSAVGKSRVIASALHSLIANDPFPDGELQQELLSKYPHHILLVNTESDDLEVGDTYKAQGWTEQELEDHLTILREIINDQKIEETFNVDNSKHIAALSQVIKEVHASVVILDPLIEFHRRNTISDSQIRELQAKLVFLARQWHVAIIAMVHWNKNEKQSNNNRMSGSHQLAASVRSVITLYKGKNGQRVFWQQKNTNGPDDIPDLGYAIVEPDGMVLWGKPVGTNENSKTYQAEQWLKEYLGKFNEMPVAECITVCSSMFSERTLRQARHNLDFDIYTRKKLIGPKMVAHWGLRTEANLWGMFKLSTGTPVQ